MGEPTVYVASLNEEDGFFYGGDTPEEAIAELLKDHTPDDLEDRRAVFVGHESEWSPRLRADDILDTVLNQATDELAESLTSSMEGAVDHIDPDEKAAFQEELNALVGRFLAKHGVAPVRCIAGVEEFPIPSIAPGWDANGAPV
jgi:hypothetical protein